MYVSYGNCFLPSKQAPFPHTFPRNLNTALNLTTEPNFQTIKLQLYFRGLSFFCLFSHYLIVKIVTALGSYPVVFSSLFTSKYIHVMLNQSHIGRHCDVQLRFVGVYLKMPVQFSNLSSCFRLSFFTKSLFLLCLLSVC